MEMKKPGLLDGAGEGDEGESSEPGQSGGNAFLKLPYGLANGRNLSTDGMRPREVWDMLKGEGVNKEAEEDKLAKKLDEPPTGNGVAQVPSTNVVKKQYNTAKEAYKKISLSGIEKSFAGEIENRLLDLANAYGVDFTALEIKGRKSRNTFGDYLGQLGKDSLDNIFFKSNLSFSNVLMQDSEVAAHYLSANARHIGSKNISKLGTVDHEIAHAIDVQFALKNDANLQKVVSFYNGVKLSNNLETRNTQINQINTINSMLHSDEHNLSGKVKKQLMSEYKLDDRSFKELVKKELGEYAVTETAEFFAEGFSAYRNIPKEQQSDFVKKFGEYTEKNIMEVFKDAKA